MTEKFKHWKSSEIVALLQLRFPSTEYSLLEQVRDSTGYAGSAYADAVIMSLWPSRGLDLMGVEIKISRGDWLRELKKPEKAEAISQFCDRWWIVTAPDIVKGDELPRTWGLLEVNEKGDKLVMKKDAPKLTPKSYDLPFIAALFRAQVKKVDRMPTTEQMDVIQAEQKGFTRGRKAHEDHIMRARTHMRKIANELDRMLTGYREHPNMDMDPYYGFKNGDGI